MAAFLLLFNYFTTLSASRLHTIMIYILFPRMDIKTELSSALKLHIMVTQS